MPEIKAKQKHLVTLSYKVVKQNHLVKISYKVKSYKMICDSSAITAFQVLDPRPLEFRKWALFHAILEKE